MFASLRTATMPPSEVCSCRSTLSRSAPLASHMIPMIQPASGPDESRVSGEHVRTPEFPCHGGGQEDFDQAIILLLRMELTRRRNQNRPG